MASTKPNTILHDFSQGHAVRAQEFLGAHPEVRDGQDGWVFRVWAPHARSVAVMGDFNGWNDSDHPMELLSDGVMPLWNFLFPVNGSVRYPYGELTFILRSG